MKVFISGPMSGKPYYNRAAFFKAEEELEKHGYSVWNPAWLAYPSDTEFTKDDMHIIDFAALRRCDAIYMLKGWKHSKGAQEECEYAIMRGLMIMYEGVHCWGKEPEFDKEFAYDEAVKNRTNYQLEAIKENIKESRNETRYKCNGINRAINNVEADLDNFKDETDGKMNDIYDTLHRHGENLDDCKKEIDLLWNNAFTGLEKRVDLLLKYRNDFAESYTVNITNLRKEVKSIKESIGTDNLQEQLEKDFADVYEEFQNTKDQVNDINMGYIKWSSEVSHFDERIEKLEENMKEIAANGGLGISFNLMNERVSSNKRDILSLRNDISDIRRIVNSSDIENISIKAMNDRMNLFAKELDTLSDKYEQLSRRLYNNDDALERRIKSIENRLNVKPFYGPDDDDD